VTSCRLTLRSPPVQDSWNYKPWHCALFDSFQVIRKHNVVNSCYVSWAIGDRKLWGFKQQKWPTRSFNSTASRGKNTHLFSHTIICSMPWYKHFTRN